MKNPLNIKRRHPLAHSAAAAAATTAAAAALSLAGCNMFAPPPAATPPLVQETERRMDGLPPLDSVDRERLRAAAAAASAKKDTVPVIKPAAGAATPSAAITPTAAPAASGAPATPAAASPGASAPVILASSNPPSTPPAAGSTTPAVTPVPPVAPATPVTGGVAESTSTPTTSAATLPTVPPMSGIVVAPLSGGESAVASATIAPFTPPTTPSASAMGSMNAVLASAQVTTGETPAAPPEQSVDQALDVLSKSIADHPTLKTALALALLNDDKAGIEAIKKLSTGDQKVATDLLAAIDAMKSKDAAPTLAARTAPILDAARAWQADADLALPRLVLATRVDSFGVFTPTSSTFSQGQRHTVIIYCEVANFTSTKGDDGWYTTKLSQQETLFTEDGLLVWRPNAEDVEDRSLNQRHDFYLVKKLTIPETLAAGKYTLRMNVTDRNANKFKIVEMPIEIVNK